jgi:hypothetical protein
MKRVFRGTLAILCSVFFTGCAPVAVLDVTKTAKGFYEPTNAGAVEILKLRPTWDFDEIATVTVGNYEVLDTAQMHNALRTKVAALGADAVIMADEGVYVIDEIPYRWMAGVAIRRR